MYSKREDSDHVSEMRRLLSCIRKGNTLFMYLKREDSVHVSEKKDSDHVKREDSDHVSKKGTH